MDLKEKVMIFIGICSLTGIIGSTVLIATNEIKNQRLNSEEVQAIKEANKTECKKYLVKHTEISGTEQLRELICNDPQLYLNGNPDLNKALDTYKQITNSFY